MSNRIAQCEACQSRYKIPDSFTGNRAKCKKCGAIMVVPPAGEDSSGPAPAAAPAKKPTAARSGASRAPGRKPPQPPNAAPRAGRAGRSSRSSRAGGATRRAGSERQTRGTRTRRPAKTSKSLDPKLLIGLAVGLVVVIVVVVLLVTSGGGTDQPDPAQASTSTPAPESSPDQPEAQPDQPPAVVPDLVPAETKPVDQAKAPEAAPKSAPEPEKPEELDPIISFASHECEHFPKTPDTTDEEWTEIERLVQSVMNDRGAKGTRAGRRLTSKYAFKAIPALINTYDGMDLSDPMVRVNAQYISRLLEEIFHKVVKVGFKAGDSEKDLRSNISLINSFIPYWKKRVEDPDAMTKTRDLIDEAAAKDEDQAP